MIHKVPRDTLFRPQPNEQDQMGPAHEGDIGKFRLTLGEYSDGTPFYKLDCWKLTTDNAFKIPKVSFTGSTMFIHDISQVTWATQNTWK